MRISDTKVAQLVETNPPQLLIIDETTGAEIAFTAEEADNLYHALAYFDPYLHGMFSVK